MSAGNKHIFQRHNRSHYSSFRQHIGCLFSVALLICVPYLNGCSPPLVLGGAAVYAMLLESERQNQTVQPRSSRNRRTYQSRVNTRLPNNRSPANTAQFTNRAQPEQKPLKRKATQEPAQQSRQELILAEAAQAYKKLRWEEARRLLNSTINQNDLSKSGLYRAYILLGAMDYQTGNVKAAETSFKKAYKENPQMSPSPELFPPPMVEFYNTVNRKQQSSEHEQELPLA